ncbi:MAG TPA: bifunctional phosphopantothenoylcysteine decarboxylase/phosphopantothenate--cysteine ligase CoaBC [Candidatus Saccharimonadales bacterium]|nr:bifunctional phosphopantothenoylcysteine decarboxylase/phosphopantothenate--cysteine ligase CoaBC [Candidatus Saccharimonadales bacterium]
MKKTIILGITSGIAAYKALELLTLLKQADIDVFVIMTKNTTYIIPPEEIERISGNKVYVELFGKNFNYKDILEKRTVDHIALADKADLMIIAPATANIIAKLAHGFADDFLTTTALAMTNPMIIAPAMNVNMWNNPIVQENIFKLRQLGYIIIEPAEGMLACGYEGVGRLENGEIIKDAILTELKSNQSLKGKKIIVTAGGTTERIDTVRSITNRSSGKMGIAIAEACFRRGSEILLLRAKNAVKSRYHIAEKTFDTTEELLELVQEHSKDYDYFYHTAAVSDFTLVEQIKGKISSDKAITLSLQPQIKVVDQIKKRNKNIKLIAFKAEYNLTEEKLIDKAREKLIKTKADAVVANDISKSDRGFESDMNEAIIVLANGEIKTISYASKKEIANEIVDYISENI